MALNPNERNIKLIVRQILENVKRLAGFSVEVDNKIRPVDERVTAVDRRVTGVTTRVTTLEEGDQISQVPTFAIENGVIPRLANETLPNIDDIRFPDPDDDTRRLTQARGTHRKWLVLHSNTTFRPLGTAPDGIPETSNYFLSQDVTFTGQRYQLAEIIENDGVAGPIWVRGTNQESGTDWNDWRRYRSDLDQRLDAAIANFSVVTRRQRQRIQTITFANPIANPELETRTVTNPDGSTDTSIVGINSDRARINRSTDFTLSEGWRQLDNLGFHFLSSVWNITDVREGSETQDIGKINYNRGSLSRGLNQGTYRQTESTVVLDGMAVGEDIPWVNTSSNPINGGAPGLLLLVKTGDNTFRFDLYTDDQWEGRTEDDGTVIPAGTARVMLFSIR